MPTAEDTARRAYDLAETRRARAVDEWAEAYANDQVWPSNDHAAKAARLSDRKDKANQAFLRTYQVYIDSL